MRRLEIAQPDDWHVHFRDGDLLSYTVKATASHFARALVMPNLLPPLTTFQELVSYRERIFKQLEKGNTFEPYLTFYLNESISPEDLKQASKYHWVLGAKLYPQGVTTNSAEGARSIRALYPLLDIMQSEGLVLQIHGEVVSGDIFEREIRFLNDHLKDILSNFPKLKVVLEHISTAQAVQFITEAPSNLAATITPHHLLYNRNQLLAGGIRPHYYCLPILKHVDDQHALQKAAVSGCPKFFAGTDSAPHSLQQKECSEGCAGVYSAPIAVSMYAEVFEALDALDKLDPFLSQFGAEFYDLPLSRERLELVRAPFRVSDSFNMGNIEVVPAHAGQGLAWSVQ